MVNDAIRTLDGPALTRLAHTLGLAPHVVRYTSQGRERDNILYDPATGAVWEPHRRLDQGDAVFRQLRQHGWKTTDHASGLHEGVVAAVLWRTPNQPHDLSIEVQYGGVVNEDSEAMALLRCAVLARAAQREARAMSFPPAADPHPCTHDLSAVVQGDEGTAYCGACEAEARARETEHA